MPGVALNMRWCGVLVSGWVLAVGAALGADETPKPEQPTTKPAIVMPSAAGLPSSVDLRPEFKRLGLAPRSQGKRPTCSVFTTAGTMEFAVSKCLGKPSQLSVEYLNWTANQIIGNKTKSRGQFFRHLLAGYDRYGICLESAMPYRRAFDPENLPSQAARNGAKEIRDLGLQIHMIAHEIPGHTDGAERKAAAVLEVERTLARGYPVAAGSHHSLLLVGYREDPSQPGGGVFLTRDSGKGRYSSVTFEHVQTKMGGFFWVEPPAKSAAAPQTRPATDAK